MVLESIYIKAQKLVKDTFTGQEEHQEMRLKIIKIPKSERALIVDGVSYVSGSKLNPSEAVYWLLYNLKDHPTKKCAHCKAVFKLLKFINIREGYRQQQYCSWACRSRDPAFALKIAKTNLERYGHTNNMWGTTRDKTKKKWILEHGVDNPMKRQDILTKCKETNRKNRGVDWPAQSGCVQELYKKSIKEKYGVDHIFKTDKSKNTCLARYGVENPMQHPPIFEKTQRYKRKIGSMPSGKSYSYQGFEDVGIRGLLDCGFKEEDIAISNVEKIPSIEYWNPVKNRICVYFPDIFIKSENRLIEIKSSYTLKAQLKENLAKHEAAKSLGFKHEIWVCSSKKVIEIIL